MNAIDIARKMAALGQKEDAINAYKLALQNDGAEPVEHLEAAMYILKAGGDHRISFTSFLKLYRQGCFQEEILQIITSTFYSPNAHLFKNRYERNCKLLARYTYFSRIDFLPFEELPIIFFPYDENGFVPFYKKEKKFGEYVNFNYPAVTHNFFKDLDNPIRAVNVFSQYELEYLNDNVRESEHIARENHIYLCYSDWAIFCAHLQCLNFRKLLERKKFVFLIEDEVEQYPVDFKEKYGIDYSQFAVKPVDITEISRLIWHVQFSSHNGGDFFNEIFDSHPNLIMVPSVWLSDMERLTKEMEQTLLTGKNCVSWEPADGNKQKITTLVGMLRKLKKRTQKDLFVAVLMYISDLRALDYTARIAPSIFIQPHFPNIHYSIGSGPDGKAIAFSPEYEKIHRSPFFNGFPYIKTFSPVRRFTTSYGGSVRYSYNASMAMPADGEPAHIVGNLMMQRILNRSYLIDPQIRVYMDSRLVRFEDGKLNPKATFTALAAFLDLPYTESMTYCSNAGERNPFSNVEGYAAGFDPSSVYKTYDDYANHDERYFLEYFLSEAYKYCGYDFQYYDGKPIDLERAKELTAGFTKLRGFIEESRMNAGIWNMKGKRSQNVIDEEEARKKLRPKIVKTLDELNDTWVKCAEMLLQNLRFLNAEGQPLRMMPKLELDPELLEQPLYH